jgi:hypothetical protein
LAFHTLENCWLWKKKSQRCKAYTPWISNEEICNEIKCQNKIISSMSQKMWGERLTRYAFSMTLWPVPQLSNLEHSACI